MDQALNQAKSAADNAAQEEMLARVGQMTRVLHDNLRGLGFDKLLAKAAHDIPDARDRLDYVAKMTEQAAQRVLTATELASPIQDRIEADAGSISSDWQAALAAGCSEEQYRALAERTLAFLGETRDGAAVTKQQLMDIMMAQDFQDLTGQVIKKVTELAHNIEQQLVQLLVDYSPTEVRREVSNGLLNGPQINPTGNADVVSSQGQVDDLLESLGF
ncbi:protein phosphatase CheZ [Noviherbaspirillum denitrificans]|uniref:Protein phosphatase CheZ n=2 Tax=Noviherbaspirillum denitrificans TaxID=1968433 RepID=A0A254TJ23_9BURK|nr:protein phosphatase CheZ [Noviherbaspirillum denitrificans]